jgi:hypothetical protein
MKSFEKAISILLEAKLAEIFFKIFKNLIKKFIYQVVGYSRL